MIHYMESGEWPLSSVPGPDPLLPALRHRGEVQDVIKLLCALVMSLKRHVAAGLGWLEHRHNVKSVQLE